MLRGLAALAVVLCGSLAAVPARAAAPCHDQSKACGRRAFDAGVRAFRAGDYQTALARFRQAYAIGHLPVVGFNLAITEEKLGDYQHALQHVDEVLQDPKASAATKTKVQVARTRIMAHLGQLSVEMPGATQVSIEVDGTARDVHDNAALVMPGHHTVRVVADGKQRLLKDVDVTAGERLVLRIEQAPAPAPAPARHPSDHASKVRRPLGPVWFYASAGVTVVVAGVMTWSGLDTLAAKNQLDKDRPHLTLAQEQDRINAGHRMELRTNFLIAATGITAAATLAIGLFAVRWKPTEHVSFGVGPGGVAAMGRF